MAIAYSKEELEFLCKNSFSYNEILEKTGRTKAGPNRERLKKYIKLYDIDISHFTHSTSPIKPSKQLKELPITRICTKCGIEKNTNNDFYWQNGRPRIICKDCVKQQLKERYTLQVADINQIKEQSGCAKCSENKYYLLEFHHRNPNEKDFAIAEKIGHRKDLILAEIEKCDILCANCHREWHHLFQKNPNLNYFNWLKS